MTWIKVQELPAAQVAHLAASNLLASDLRVVWKGKTPADNVIFLATGETLVDMVDDTTQPDDIFELWAPSVDDT